MEEHICSRWRTCSRSILFPIYNVPDPGLGGGVYGEKVGKGVCTLIKSDMQECDELSSYRSMGIVL